MLYMWGEMLKAGLLNGFLLGDSKMNIRKNSGIEINIQPENYIYHTVQIGDQNVKVYFFDQDLSSRVVFEIKPTLAASKNDELLELCRLTDAYGMSGVLIASEDATIDMIRCFNDAVLEIRARAYGTYMFETNEATKGDVQYLAISGAMLTSQLEADTPTELMNDYVAWYHTAAGKNGISGYGTKLQGIYDIYKGSNPEAARLFRGISLSNLSPTQIIELDKKLKNENYPLDLGDPPS